MSRNCSALNQLRNFIIQQTFKTFEEMLRVTEILSSMFKLFQAQNPKEKVASYNKATWFLCIFKTSDILLCNGNEIMASRALINFRGFRGRETKVQVLAARHECLQEIFVPQRQVQSLSSETTIGTNLVDCLATRFSQWTQLLLCKQCTSVHIQHPVTEETAESCKSP